jgi:hypothetical protein
MAITKAQMFMDNQSIKKCPQYNVSQFQRIKFKKNCLSVITFFRMSLVSSSKIEGWDYFCFLQMLFQKAEDFVIFLAAPGLQSYITRVSPATIQWLLQNYETAEGVSLPRSTLYSHYLRHW